MFVIYENATKNDDPLEKCFKFPEDCIVRYENQHMTVNAGKIVKFKVKRKGKVYADHYPAAIWTKEV